MLPTRIVFIVACILALAPTTRGVTAPALDEVLARAAAYVRRFERDFAVVISDEDYRQSESFDSERRVEATNDVPRPYRVERGLDVHSEMLFLWLAQDRSWISVRSPLRVGRQSVADSKDRLERVLRDESPGQVTRLRQLAMESARFNLGFYHDYNNPTLVLQFLDPEFQPRFEFTVVGRERVNGVDAVRLAFSERQEPTVIQSDGESLFSTGSLWIADDAVVVRTLLRLKVPPTRSMAGMNGSVLVDYRRDPKLAMWVPAKMEETYEQVGGVNDAIRCTATYSHFRRFETSVRIVP